MFFFTGHLRTTPVTPSKPSKILFLSVLDPMQKFSGETTGHFLPGHFHNKVSDPLGVLREHYQIHLLSSLGSFPLLSVFEGIFH